MAGKSWKENLTEKELTQRRQKRNKRKTISQKSRPWGKGNKRRPRGILIYGS